MHQWISPRESRAARRKALVLIILLALAAALAAGAVSAFGSERAATVRLGGCSGVNVDPRGLVLTVRHCGAPEIISVEFLSPGRTVTGRRVYVGEFRADDVAAYRLPVGDYPAAPVAKRPPQRGDVVYSFGYPSGRLEALSGRVIGTATYSDGTPLIVTTLPARSGHSGGPLFNLDGEVIALCSTSETAQAPARVEGAAESNWIATPRIQAALAFAQGMPAPNAESPSLSAPPPTNPRSPRLYVFTSVWCEPCRVFREDYERNIGGLRDFLQAQGFERTRAGRHYGAVEWMPLGWDRPEVARACEVATGLAPRTVPTFWMNGAKDSLVGYAGPEKLKGYLTAQLAAQSPPSDQPAAPIPGPAPPGPPLPPLANPPGPAPTPEAAPQPFQRVPDGRPDPGFDSPSAQEATPRADAIDWSDVTAVVLVARQDRGAAHGAAVRLALELEGGALRRRLQEATHGRADLELIAERVAPARFGAVSQAAGITVDTAHVLLLVRRQELGAIRGKAVELIENALGGLSERSTRVPIDFVSERAHPNDYAALVAALNTPDGDAPADAPWWLAPFAGLLGLLKRRLTGVVGSG